MSQAPKYNIPFNKPCFLGSEISNIEAAISRGHISGDGYFTRRCHKQLEEELHVQKVLLTTSCTHALEMTALLLDIQPGDEVILPSFTFVSSVNAFVLRGAHPVFIDIRPDTLNLDETQLESLITSRTKAILVVHYAGVGCEMELIMKIAGKYNVPVIEDNAHGLFGKFQGRYLGTFGSLATQSFHETKNFTCGEGGALLINDSQFNNRAEYIREKGTNRTKFFRRQVDKYTWIDIGSSYLPSDLLAGFLIAQLEARDEIQAKRKLIWDTYQEHLEPISRSTSILLPTIPEGCEQSFHMYYLLLPDLDTRQDLIDHLKARGVMAIFHYLPLHLSKMGTMFGGKIGDCPITESVSDRLLRLPFYYALTREEQMFVIHSIAEFYN